MKNSDYPLVIKVGLLENPYFLTIFPVRNIHFFIGLLSLQTRAELCTPEFHLGSA